MQLPSDRVGGRWRNRNGSLPVYTTVRHIRSTGSSTGYVSVGESLGYAVSKDLSSQQVEQIRRFARWVAGETGGEREGGGSLRKLSAIARCLTRDANALLASLVHATDNGSPLTPLQLYDALAMRNKLGASADRGRWRNPAIWTAELRVWLSLCWGIDTPDEYVRLAQAESFKRSMGLGGGLSSGGAAGASDTNSSDRNRSGYNSFDYSNVGYGLMYEHCEPKTLVDVYVVFCHCSVGIL